MLFSEGWKFSNRKDIGAMIKRIIAFEEDRANSSLGDQYVTHDTLRELWMIVDKFEQSMKDYKPTAIQILTALGD